jgi:hypothetical protein
MADPQGPSMNADDPLGIGAAESREQYFERAVRRLDELGGLLREAGLEPEQIEIEDVRTAETVRADLGTPDGREAAAEAFNNIAAAKLAAEGEAEPEQEPMTREAIERDPWNAVALDIPDDAGPALLTTITEAIRDVRPILEKRAAQATTPEQQEFWREFADDAAQRQEFVAELLAEMPAAEITPAVEETDTIALAEAIDDDRRRHRDDPDALRESPREDRFSSDRIDEQRQSHEEPAEPLYDRYTGERLDEAGQEHEAGRDLGGGRGLFR